MKHTGLLLKDAYGTEAMRAVWDERNMVQKWLDVEAAIAGAQKELELIPGEVADKIIAKCTVDKLPPDLGLEVSDIDLHQRIDRFSELLNILALIGATLGQLGLEIRDLQRTEIAEVGEPWESGKHHSSSTMPHKRIPTSSEW